MVPVAPLITDITLFLNSPFAIFFYYYYYYYVLSPVCRLFTIMPFQQTTFLLYMFQLFCGYSFAAHEVLFSMLKVLCLLLLLLF